MGRPPTCSDGNGLKKGSWTHEEDEKLRTYIENQGHGSWRALPKNAGLNRCGKSCRLRWTNYLRPDIKRGKFSKEEEQTILHWHSILGNKWSSIASYLPGRTDSEIKNFWNTHLKKKLIRMDFDPIIHKPRTDSLCSNLSQLIIPLIPNLRDLISLLYVQQYFPYLTATAPPAISVSPYYQTLAGQGAMAEAALDIFYNTLLPGRDNIGVLEYSQQHQDQGLWLSQLCMQESQVQHGLPSRELAQSDGNSLLNPLGHQGGKISSITSPDSLWGFLSTAPTNWAPLATIGTSISNLSDGFGLGSTAATSSGEGSPCLLEDSFLLEGQALLHENLSYS